MESSTFSKMASFFYQTLLIINVKEVYVFLFEFLLNIKMQKAEKINKPQLRDARGKVKNANI